MVIVDRVDFIKQGEIWHVEVGDVDGEGYLQWSWPEGGAENPGPVQKRMAWEGRSSGAQALNHP